MALISGFLPAQLGTVAKARGSRPACSMITRFWDLWRLAASRPYQTFTARAAFARGPGGREPACPGGGPRIRARAGSAGGVLAGPCGPT